MLVVTFSIPDANCLWLLVSLSILWPFVKILCHDCISSKQFTSIGVDDFTGVPVRVGVMLHLTLVSRPEINNWMWWG